ncbi:MAG: MurR/RpiR family transcriptional regulator [Lachnospiraceae bacterium]|nr:MurR/RpiR family transcriptional regulator [Lachnospiraceae bacterium]
MTEQLTERISSSMNGLSKGQKLIADFILLHYDKAAYMTAARLGETVGVSESTVVRFATELGYDGYPELQNAMQEMIRDKLTSVQRIDVAANRINSDDVLASVLNHDIKLIKKTLDGADRELFNLAVKSIVNARTIYIFAVKSSFALARFLGYYFELIFGNVKIIETTSKTEMYEQLFRIDKQDVMIGISFPRYSASTMDAMCFASEKGATVIAITDSMTSPVTKISDCVLLARSDMASVVDSIVAPMSLINALIVATVEEKRDEVTQTFKELEGIWEKYDLYIKNGERTTGEKQ